jgi:toxin YoeB
MKVTFGNNKVFEDFTAWALEDKRTYKKILSLIKDIKRNPYDGIGKPEPLKHGLSGLYSRRIDEEHRLVYQIIEAENEAESTLVIASCKSHYEINMKDISK